MQRIVTRINQVFSAIAGWLMLVLMCILVADILWRILWKPLLGMAEISVFVMMIVIYLGFSRCEEHNEHVRLEFLVGKAHGGRFARYLVLLVRVISMATVGLFFYAILKSALSAFITNASIEGLISLPLWPVMFLMVVGMSAFFVQSILKVFQSPQETPDSVLDDDRAGRNGNE